MHGLFCSLPFHNGGHFLGVFRSYGQTLRSNFHEIRYQRIRCKTPFVGAKPPGRDAGLCVSILYLYFSSTKPTVHRTNSIMESDY